ncbi:MAG: amino acid permease [Dongiaceae bacterium]
MVDISQSGEQRIFLRKASGLIRTASFLDVFIFNTGLISVGIGIGTMVLYGPAFYPGASLLWALVGGAAALAVCTLGFAYWAVSIPRSGGDYVFNSRIWPPFIAVTASFTNILTQVFFGAVAAYWVILIGLSPMFSIIGDLSGNPGWTELSNKILEPTWVFVIGLGILSLSHLILYLGMKIYLLTQKVIFAVAFLGLLVLIIVLWTGDTEAFKANLNTVYASVLGVPDVYQGIIDSAKQEGWGYDGPADFVTIMKLSNWVMLPFIGAWLSIFIGGEVKQAATSQMWGMMSACVAAFLLWLVTQEGALAAFGYDFIGAADYNFLMGVGVSINPNIPALAGIMTDSMAITWIGSIAMIAWIWMWIPGVQTTAIRAMVAWSLDRVAPAAFGHISPTRHTPSVAILISYLFSLVFLACIAFTDYAKTIIIIGVPLTIAWAITLLGGVFYPLYRKHLFIRSPIANQKLFGVPAMSVICLVGTVFMTWAVVNLLIDPVAAGHDPVQLSIVAAVILAGLIFYFTMKAIRRGQGVDITQAFKEIPVE